MIPQEQTAHKKEKSMKRIVLLMVMVLLFPAASLSAEFALVAASTDVNFEWDANTEPDLAGYNIYRSEVSGGPYELIATLGPEAVSYTDPALPDGELFWIARAVDTAGNEAPASIEVTAVLDTIPPAAVKNFRIVPTVVVPLILD
jgi:hypothetical protein